MDRDSMQRDIVVCAFAALVLFICWAMAVTAP